jgi:hypothetical protein
LLSQAISARIRQRVRNREGDERAAEMWEHVNALYERATGLHLEPRQTILASAREIAGAKRRGAL